MTASKARSSALLGIAVVWFCGYVVGFHTGVRTVVHPSPEQQAWLQMKGSHADD